MKKTLILMAFGIVLFGCQNNATQQKVKEETIVTTPATPRRDYKAELDNLIKESGLQVRNGDYYDIISVDTAYCQAFYDLWKDICDSPYKNTSVCNDALAISVSVAFFKNEVQSGKKKVAAPKPAKKEWDIKIGCTREFVLDAWGKPDHTATSESAVGKIEMLYYYDRHKIITIVDGWVEQIDSYD